MEKKTVVVGVVQNKDTKESFSYSFAHPKATETEMLMFVEAQLNLLFEVVDTSKFSLNNGVIVVKNKIR